MIRHWHRPGAFAISLTIAGITFFLALAAWQLRRADEKTALFAAFADAGMRSPIALEQARREATSARYPRIQAAGHYDPDHFYVLDNQVRGRRAGVMVFDVFAPSDGSVSLLVNRGFVARDARGTLPAIPAPDKGGQVLGALYAPPPGSGLRMGGNALPRQRQWPKTTIYIDPGEIAVDLGRALDPRVLLLLPEPGNRYLREWKPEVFPAERHLGYAFTWLTFAAVAGGIFFILHWRKERPSQ